MYSKAVRLLLACAISNLSGCCTLSEGVQVVAKLSEEAIQERLTKIPGWERKDNEIVKKYRFNDFKGSMAFVNRVADLAEAAGHHPDIFISWNRVTLSLSTHSEGGLTDKDFDLAEQIDGL